MSRYVIQKVRRSYSPFIFLFGLSALGLHPNQIHKEPSLRRGQVLTITLDGKLPALAAFKDSRNDLPQDRKSKAHHEVQKSISLSSGTGQISFLRGMGRPEGSFQKKAKTQKNLKNQRH